MELKEFKEAVDGMTAAFDEFKKTNDARLKEIEKRGAADPVTEEKLSKLSQQLDQFEGLNQKITLAAEQSKAAKEAAEKAQASAEAAELKAGRWNGGGGGGRSPEKEAERKAFDIFLRRGKEGADPAEIKVLKVSEDTAGGFLAPTEYVREIIKGEVEYSPIRQLVRVRQTTMKSVQVPRRTGTFSARWVAEIQTRTETTGLAYALEELPTHEMTAEVYISMQELEDSAFDLEEEIRMEFTEQFGVAEGAAVVAGNGVGKPEGILANPDVTTVNSGAATEVSLNGFIDLFYGVKTAYAKNGTFLLNRSSLAATRKIKDTTGQYIWQPGFSQGVPNTILGAPYVEVPDMPNQAAAAKPVVFGDLRRAYMLVDRIAMSTLRDPYTRASVGQVKFVGRRRIGGQVVLPEAVRAMVCST